MSSKANSLLRRTRHSRNQFYILLVTFWSVFIHRILHNVVKFTANNTSDNKHLERFVQNMALRPADDSFIACTRCAKKRGGLHLTVTMLLIWSDFYDFCIVLLINECYTITIYNIQRVVKNESYCSEMNASSWKQQANKTAFLRYHLNFGQLRFLVF